MRNREAALEVRYLLEYAYKVAYDNNLAVEFCCNSHFGVIDVDTDETLAEGYR